jgi:hypothetical protein
MFSSIVHVHDTTLPLPSATVKCVVDDFMRFESSAGQGWLLLPSGEPAATGMATARPTLIRSRRRAPYCRDAISDSGSGYSAKSASPRYASRSANAMF